MNSSATFVLRLFRAPLKGEGAVHSPEELKLIATATRRMGLLPPFQEEIIHRAIELNHVTVREIMTPRGKIFSLPATMPLEQASARIVEEQHSRIPVYDPAAGPEHIIGVVYSKDISRLMHFRAVALSLGGNRDSSNRDSHLTLRQVMREITVVPETKLAVELLQEFQERRRQIAVVVDEFGSTVGIVTAEDALEQIVGELEDEFDIASRTTTLSAAGALSGTFSLDGSATLRDLSTQLRWTFPREAGVETLAGFPASAPWPPSGGRRVARLRRPALHHRRDGRAPHRPCRHRAHRDDRRPGRSTHRRRSHRRRPRRVQTRRGQEARA